jgi:hypothetical protein
MSILNVIELHDSHHHLFIVKNKIEQVAFHAIFGDFCPDR